LKIVVAINAVIGVDATATTYISQNANALGCVSRARREIPLFDS